MAACLSAGGRLDGAGWAKTKDGDCEVEGVCFKHNQALRPGDVWRMKVEGGGAAAGFAGEAYDPTRDDETSDSTASTLIAICSGLRLEEERHIPSLLPFEIALRVNHDGNVPQVQFNEDGVWHDFAPDQGEGRTALKAGPWFPYLIVGRVIF